MRAFDRVLVTAGHSRVDAARAVPVDPTPAPLLLPTISSSFPASVAWQSFTDSDQIPLFSISFIDKFQKQWEIKYKLKFGLYFVLSNHIIKLAVGGSTMRVHFIIITALSLGFFGCGSRSVLTTNNSTCWTESTTVKNVESTANKAASDSGNKYIDFNYPVYLVEDESLFVGCQKVGTMRGNFCRGVRMAAIKRGAQEWSIYFSAGTGAHPEIIVADKLGQILSPVNSPILLKVNELGCEKIDPACGTVLACYSYQNHEIDFVTSSNINPVVVAHELGHAFGLDHTAWLNKDCENPVMSEYIDVSSYYVTDLDIRLLCRGHKEISSCPIDVGDQFVDFGNTLECKKDWDVDENNKCHR